MKKKLLIIDSHSLIYKCFYGVRPMHSPTGTPTNAINGFLNILLKLLDTYNPDFVFAAFDAGKTTFRTQEYSQYKAGRDLMPEDLMEQVPYIKKILDALNIPQISIKDYEADDIIGSVCTMAEQKGISSTIVTGDRDSFQLAGENTSILYAKKGISDTLDITPEYISEKYNITPKQFIDVKALMGDKSDNIPGVMGVGEKTALNLIQEYENLDNMYKNIDNIKGKLKEKLINDKDNAYLSRFLAEIKCDMDLNIDLDNKINIDLSSNKLYKILKELDFKSIIKKLNLKEDEALKQKESEEIISKYVGSDISTDDFLALLKNKNCISIYFDNGYNNNINKAVVYDEQVYYIIDVTNNCELIQKVFDLDITIISYNFKEIFKSLKSKEIKARCDYDIMLMAYVINPSDERYLIEVLAMKYLGIELNKSESVIQQSLIELNNNDENNELFKNTKAVFDLYKIFIEQLKKDDMLDLYKNIEHPLMYVLSDMEYYGFKVDIDMLYKLEEEFDKKQESLTKEIRSLAGKDNSFNINSPKQLGTVLFEELKLPVIKKSKTGYSTDIEVLEKLKGMHPIIDKIIELRGVSKINSTYIKGFLKIINPKTKRIHSTFNQTITTTGRISSSNPNLQNIPIRTHEGKIIRKVFIPSSNDNLLIDADYSQIELRILAYISKDEKLKEAFRLNQDIHTRTASEVFNVAIDEVTPSQRSRAKAVNFGIVYGISDFGLSKDLNISRKEAGEYINTYLEKYPKVKEYMSDIVKDAEEKGFVKTLFNRRRYIPEIHSRNFNQRSFAQRTALNTPIQGSAADIIKIAMVNVYNRLKNENLKAKLILQVHDELIIDCPKDEVEKASLILKEEMENAVNFDVKLKVDLSVGENWYDTKE